MIEGIEGIVEGAEGVEDTSSKRESSLAVSPKSIEKDGLFADPPPAPPPAPPPTPPPVPPPVPFSDDDEGVSPSRSNRESLVERDRM